MSYIHKALKKAQIERDRGQKSYGGVVVFGRKTASGSPRKIMMWFGIGLMVLLAFAGYSWWDSRDAKDRGQGAGGRAQSAESRGQRAEVGGKKTENRSQKTEDRQLEVKSDGLGSAEGLFEKARRSHGLGQLETAQVLYQKVIETDPGHLKALNNLGVLSLQQENYESARKYFEKASHLNPRYVDPYYNLACVFTATGDTDRAVRYLKKAAALDSRVIQWAQKDPDLDPLKQQPVFLELTKEKQ